MTTIKHYIKLKDAVVILRLKIDILNLFLTVYKAINCLFPKKVLFKILGKSL